LTHNNRPDIITDSSLTGSAFWAGLQKIWNWECIKPFTEKTIPKEVESPITLELSVIYYSENRNIIFKGAPEASRNITITTTSSGTTTITYA